MKCPKCDYLGFETGDRCRNCGYDFSLLSVADAQPADYEIHPEPIDDVPVHDIDRGGDDVDDAGVDGVLRISLTPETLDEPDRIDAPADTPPAAPFAASARESTTPTDLPLFTPAGADGDDEPLIKLPAAPRPPLGVRRTPDTPRLRAVPPRAPARSPAPVLQFAEEAEPDRRETGCDAADEEARVDATADVKPGFIYTNQPGRPGARVVAMLIDYLILFGIDAAVVYFTVRMAGLAPGEWRLLPVAPMLTFLGLLKVAYFYAFTAVGGQTIGKMAVGTCVVTESGGPVDAARAMRRTSAGALSFLLLGVGFIPAFFGDHRALHDRLAGTRVVRLRSV